MKLKIEDIATYLSTAFNSHEIEELVKNALSKNELCSDMMQLSNFLMTYISSVGDLSMERMHKILNDFVKNHTEITNDDVRYGTLDSSAIYYKKYIFPLVVEQYKRKHAISGNISLNDCVNIYNEMTKISRVNRFVTHSFSGALFDEISNNGLDISKEFFKSETAFLARYGFKSVFQTGLLYLTDLSYQSMGYALLSPEKIHMAFSGITTLKERDDESVYEYHKRVIEEFVNIHGDNPDIAKAVELLNSINDFYYTNDKCCIAIMENERIVNPATFTPSYMFSYVLSNSFPFNNLFKEDETFKKIYEKADLLLQEKKDEGIDMLSTLLDYLNKKYPDREETRILNNRVEFDLFNEITMYGLNCFNSANGEGFIFESGKIPADKLAITTFINPLSLYSIYQRQKNDSLSAHADSLK